MGARLISRRFCPLLAALGFILWSRGAIALSTANFFPLVPGSSTTYSEVNKGVSGTGTYSISPTKVLFGSTYVYEAIDSTGAKGYMLNDQNGLQEFGAYYPAIFISGYGTTTVTASFSPPLVHLPASFAIGQTQASSSQMTWVLPGVGTATGPATYSNEVAGYESVTVPAGTFYAVRFDETFAGTLTASTTGKSGSVNFTITTWAVENVGTVKSVTTFSDGTTWTRELITYSIPVLSTTTTSTTAATTTTTSTTASTTTTTLVSGQINLGFGWNLVGNSFTAPIDVRATFSNPTLVTTVWKWVNSTSKWAFYTPTQADGGAVYAATKGYDLLTTINGGEGFWINANQSFTTALPGGASITSTSFQDGKPGALKLGWNLISIGNSRTPSGFNADVGATPPSAGLVPQNITTLWTWNNIQSKWYFYAPSLEAEGGTALADYIASKGYLDFRSNNTVLGPGIGFWVNKP